MPPPGFVKLVTMPDMDELEQHEVDLALDALDEAVEHISSNGARKFVIDSMHDHMKTIRRSLPGSVAYGAGKFTVWQIKSTADLIALEPPYNETVLNKFTRRIENVAKTLPY